MTRTELEDRIGYCQRELDHLKSLHTNCTTCDIFIQQTSTCQRFGVVPADFIHQGCDAWRYDDPPF